MPLIDFSNPMYVLIALVLFLLVFFLGRHTKKDTSACIMLVVFLVLLIGHTIEYLYAKNDAEVFALSRSLAVDQLFVLLSFLNYLWIDKVHTSKKEAKDGKKAPKIIEKDGLDILDKKV